MPDTAKSSKADLLEVKGMRKVFAAGGPFSAKRRVVAVEDVSFTVDCGEAVALVGESGSGKSTIARLLLRLETPDGGRILLNGEEILDREPRRASLGYRGRVQMVFQDPFGSLNPVHSVAHHLIRPLVRHQRARADQARARAVGLLRTVGLEPVEDFIDRYPYELSGGQRQRVAIARALAVEPDLLIADEPTSMLDVSIRMGILNLLAELKREQNLAILLITHDLASASYLADRILVLFQGRVVEDGPSESLVKEPAHPYTRELLSSMATSRDAVRAGKRPSELAESAIESGCPFYSRCPKRLELCRESDPAPRAFEDRVVRCHLYPNISDTPRS
jgi:oligopeptide/dipeptide ABC transporter ATP-binding protein